MRLLRAYIWFKGAVAFIIHWRKVEYNEHEIAIVIGGAASMVNVYIDKLEYSDYMNRDYKLAKVVYYDITTKELRGKIS